MCRAYPYLYKNNINDIQEEKKSLFFDKTLSKIKIVIMLLFLIVFFHIYMIYVGGINRVITVMKTDIEPINKNNMGQEIILTFDIIKEIGFTEEILKILEQEGINGSFFITGSILDKNPEIVKLIRKKGHDIGNYTLSFVDLRDLKEHEIIHEIYGLELKYKEITGEDLILFRPPMGRYNSRIVEIAGLLGYTTILWSSNIGKEGNTVDSNPNFEYLKRTVRKGAVINFDVSSPNVIKALSYVIDEIKMKGFYLKKVSEIVEKVKDVDKNVFINKNIKLYNGLYFMLKSFML